MGIKIELALLNDSRHIFKLHFYGKGKYTYTFNYTFITRRMKKVLCNEKHAQIFVSLDFRSHKFCKKWAKIHANYALYPSLNEESQ